MGSPEPAPARATSRRASFQRSFQGLGAARSHRLPCTHSGVVMPPLVLHGSSAGRRVSRSWRTPRRAASPRRFLMNTRSGPASHASRRTSARRTISSGVCVADFNFRCAYGAGGGELHNKPAHAVHLASSHQRPENHKENQAGNSPEHAVEGRCRIGADGAVAVFLFCFVLWS